MPKNLCREEVLGMGSEELFNKLCQSIIAGEAEVAIELTKRGIAEELNPLEIIDKGLIPGIHTIGDRFERGDCFIPELILAGRAMKEAIKIITPVISRQGIKREPLGKVAIGTVFGDIHDIGKGIVISMLEANGFEVIDLGVSVLDEKFVESVREYRPQILGLSSLMTTTQHKQRDVVKLLEKERMRDRVKVIVGGAVITEDFARKIGADAYGANAIDGVRKCKGLLGIEKIASL